MDVIKGSWILEFLLRQPLPGWIHNRLISTLPTQKENLFLQKTILLRRICSLVFVKDNVSEKILDSLEKIEEIDRDSGTGYLSSMSSAYCAVALHCTANFLRENDFDGFNRIWKCRVSDMEKAEGVRLFSDWLKDLRKEMEVVAANERIRDEFLRMDTRRNAWDCIYVFLEEAVREMGPPFLEFAADNMRIIDGDGETSGSGVVDLETGVADMEVDSSPNVDGEIMEVELSRDTSTGSTQPREEEVQSIQTNFTDERQVSSISKEANARPVVNFGSSGIGDKYDRLPTPDVMKAQEALRLSSMNLQTVVQDPLPDTLKVAERVLSNMPSEPMNQVGPQGKYNQVDVAAGNCSGEAVEAEAAHVREIKTVNLNDRREGTARPELMARNETACAYKWDEESIEFSANSSTKKLHLPSPRKNRVSPLKMHQKVPYRRKIKKWSLQEEEALRDAVEKHGTGKWTYILNTYAEKFEERKAGDLKDKWRIMTR